MRLRTRADAVASNPQWIIVHSRQHTDGWNDRCGSGWSILPQLVKKCTTRVVLYVGHQISSDLGPRMTAFNEYVLAQICVFLALASILCRFGPRALSVAFFVALAFGPNKHYLPAYIPIQHLLRSRHRSNRLIQDDRSIDRSPFWPPVRPGPGLSSGPVGVPSTPAPLVKGGCGVADRS